MNPQLWFGIVLLLMLILVIFFDRKYAMLRDTSTAAKKPYSYSRMQLAWWTVIVLSAFIAIFIVKCDVATLDRSQLILLGITTATIAAARLIDNSDEKNPAVLVRNQDLGSDNFMLDILSDENGVSIPRFQAVVFNLVFGIWFILKVMHNIDIIADPSAIMPVLSDNNLILIGLSSGTYAALKTTENKETSLPNPPPLPAAVTNPTPPVS
jgi:hypothetical protein